MGVGDIFSFRPGDVMVNIHEQRHLFLSSRLALGWNRMSKEQRVTKALSTEGSEPWGLFAELWLTPLCEAHGANAPI